MKKILLFLVALVATLSMNAQTTEIHNASGKVAAYLGADVNVKFGTSEEGPTIMVYKGDVWQETYKGPDYKVVSTPVEETFKAVYNTTGGANTLTFYYDANDHSGDSITVYEDGTTNYLFDNSKSNGAKWGYNEIRSSFTSIVIDASVAGYKGLTSTAYMFQGMTNATDISGAEYLDVSNVTDMSLMFMNFGGGSTNSHTTLNSVPDVSKWNTANVTNMTGMFWDYGNFSDNLTKVPDVSKWNTANVTNMAGMFQQYGYSSINFNDVPKVSGWSTVSVEDMSTMFRYYGKNSTALTAVPDVCNWNTAEVKTMAEMFREYGASSTVLKAVPDVSNWNTGNVTNMQQMFYNYGIASTNISCVLDLSGWDLSKITGTNGVNVFNFNPKTFNVTIPAKTGDKVNEESKWYYGDGTNSIAPPSGKSFTIFGQGYAAVKAEAGVSGNKVKWVQLWEGGPKFAEYNVGVTDGKAESYGDYFTWANNIAGSKWGSSWRMPTKDEFDALLANCTCEPIENYNGTGVNGVKFTGKGDFSGNSIFLPAAGIDINDVTMQGIYEYYWSSTPDDSNDGKAYAIGYHNYSMGFSVNASDRTNGFPVRAVVRDPVAVTGVSLNKTTLELGVGASETLTPTFIPADADNKNVSWTSSDETVATVDANGKVTAVAIGEATITVTTEDGNKTATCKLAVFPAGSVGTIKAKIGEKDVDVKWVQLWAGGPKFAEYNVGVTDGKAESYGGYYCWGKATDKDSQGAYKDGTSALTGTDDTATNLWGNNWRMPTKDEFDALLANCTCTWIEDYNGISVNGWLCKGKENTDYASNSVFLPAAGCYINGGVLDQSGYGSYWSSTPDGSDDAYFLYFDSGTQFVNLSYRSFGFSVRAVVNEPTTGTAKATIGGEEVDVNWVQLWENGPKFAEKNVGASSATDVGSKMTFTDATKTGADYVWGANWCTPSKDLMDELLKAASSGSEKVKCEYTQEGSTYGFKFTGLTDGYTDNSVFFPAQDVNSGYGNAHYWSATAKDSKAWYMLALYYDGWYSDWYSNNQDFEYLVRPVLKN